MVTNRNPDDHVNRGVMFVVAAGLVILVGLAGIRIIQHAGAPDASTKAAPAQRK